MLLAVAVAVGHGRSGAAPQQATGNAALPAEFLTVQGLRRVVRFYRPARLADRPAMLLVLHGGGGDGERFRAFTAQAFERLADEQGFLLAYPDALGGRWNGCRTRTPYHAAIAGVDDLGFLEAVVRRGKEMVGTPLAAVFVAGYSNGGHLVFRAALEGADFTAFGVIGGHLPIERDMDCVASETPVSIALVSGTADPINPWGGGEVRTPGGERLGEVLSAEQTVAYFRRLLGAADPPTITWHPDLDPADGTRVETRLWRAGEGREVAFMVVHGGGHTLPHPGARFPTPLVGPTGRDIDGARELWRFFSRQIPGNGQEAGR